jgi:hypothetical protein
MSAVGDFVARDSVTIVTPLGLRFRDVATGRVVGDGLGVHHVPAAGGRIRTAIATPSGVWALSDLPGLRALESGAGDAAYWAAVPPLVRAFEVEVSDPRGRYLPLRLQTEAPFRGLFTPLCGSPLTGDVGIPLFRAPREPAPPGYAIVRATLREPSGAPAAWAVLELQADGGDPALGMADERGQVAVPLPYPAPPHTAGSPLRGSRRPLAEERWSLSIACRYDRSCPPTLAPDLCTALEQAPAALELQGVALELAYGRDLVLRTPGHSEVLVLAAASPP